MWSRREFEGEVRFEKEEGKTGGEQQLGCGWKKEKYRTKIDFLFLSFSASTDVAHSEK